MYQLILVAVVLCILFKLLNVNNFPKKSLFYCSNGNFLEQIVKNAPLLNEPYSPPRLWGYSGHVQTIIQGLISLIHCPLVNGKRYSIKAEDGATLTYDVYQPIDKNSDTDITLAICPGIGNSSESVYIRRVVYHAQLEGFRVVVLNHLGTLKKLTLTAPRIFSYGCTDDYRLMINDLLQRYVRTKVICIGFSMGGNIITKFLGEPKVPKEIIAGISVCQGYDAKATSKRLLDWEGFRRLYFYAMTENKKSILRHWQRILLTDEVKAKNSINERAMWSAGSLIELDEAYTRRIAGCSSLDEFYAKSSCINYWDNITIPMVFLNSLDDPIVPPILLQNVRKATERHSNFLSIEQQYGGHLGFYEGGFVYPSPLTWLDRWVVQVSSSLVAYTSSEKSSMVDDSSTDSQPTSSSDEEPSSEDEVSRGHLSGAYRPKFVCRRKFYAPGKYHLF